MIIISAPSNMINSRTKLTPRRKWQTGTHEAVLGLKTYTQECINA